jgi:hypothetical protein
MCFAWTNNRGQLLGGTNAVPNKKNRKKVGFLNVEDVRIQKKIIIPLVLYTIRACTAETIVNGDRVRFSF